MRKLSVFGVAIVAALTGSGAPHAQTPATNQRVWTGTWEQHDSWEGSNIWPQPGADQLRLRRGPGRVRVAAVGIAPADVERAVGREHFRRPAALKQRRYRQH